MSDTAAPWSRLMSFLFVGFVHFHLFPHSFVCACVWTSAIFGNGWHARMGLGDIFGSFQFGGVRPAGWAHAPYVTHATGTPMHDLVRNGLALSPLIVICQMKIQILGIFVSVGLFILQLSFFCFCFFFLLLAIWTEPILVSFSFSPFIGLFLLGRTTTSASVDNVPAPVSRACWT